MNVTVFGIGYVGLVQAAVLADVGHHVICVDVNEDKVEGLKKGIIPIYEPGLTELVNENYRNGRLEFVTNAEIGIEHGEIQFIAVGTPPDEDGSADLQYVLGVVATIAAHMISPKIIVTKSTVPVGSADKINDKIVEVLQQRNVSIEYHIASNPEFLKEGSAVQDCQLPDRIVVGTDNKMVETKLRKLYESFNQDRDRMVMMDIKSAELTKYAANCILATKISFMNEMANLAEKLGANIEAVRDGIGSDSRIGYEFISPGCGYGGSCFPKDVQALIRTADGIGYSADILKSVETVNDRQKEKLFEKINSHYNGELKGKVFALWGLSFKPGTDDMREAPSRVLMETLWRAGARVQAYDPEAMSECERIYGNNDALELMKDKESVLKNADALILVTEWKDFKTPDFGVIKKNLNEAVIFDGRNQYDMQQLSEEGFIYYSIGRKQKKIQ